MDSLSEPVAMSGLLAAGDSAQGRQNQYDNVMSVKSGGAENRAAGKLESIREEGGVNEVTKYHYYSELMDDGENEGSESGQDDSKTSIRVAKLEHQAEVQAHRLEALENAKKSAATKQSKKRRCCCGCCFVLLWLTITAIILAMFLLHSSSTTENATETTDPGPATAATTTTSSPPRAKHFKSCLDAHQSSENAKGGVYLVSLDPVWNPFSVSRARCYMDDDDDELGGDRLGGGWTVIQGRGQFGNPMDYFDRKWEEYKNGFGDLDKEFWLGLDSIKSLTDSKPHELAILLREVGEDGKLIVARYSSVRLEGDQFRLFLGRHSGTAGDPLSKFIKEDGLSFSAPDRDNDQSRKGHCAQKYKSGWWFASCGVSNLNGLNFNSATAPEAKGIVFSDRKHPFTYSFAEAKMMIRPAEEAQ